MITSITTWLLVFATVGAGEQISVPTNAQPKTIGGEPAAYGQLLFIVSIRNSLTNTHICSGSIVAKGWVVTAASCVSESPKPQPHDLRVVTGSRKTNTTEGHFYEVQKIVIHREYNVNTSLNDIALVKTTRWMFWLPFPTNQVTKIYIGEIGVNRSVVVAGWGQESHNALTVGTLKVIKYTTTDSEGECKSSHHLICAKSWNDEGACDGDIGGPLIDERSNTLVGILSIIYDTCASGYPEAFTRVTTHIPWMQKHIGFLWIPSY